MIEAVYYKLLQRGPLELHYFHTKFHYILPSGSKLTSGGGAHIQTGDLINLLSFESRLKTVLRKIWWENFDGNHVAQGRVLYQDFVYMAVNLRNP
jgi:hypothetical protein